MLVQNAFAVIHTWPDLKNAEYEVLQRVLTAARHIGVSIVVIDNDAKVLWASPKLALPEGTLLDPAVVDFVLSLHFESPRVIDAYSYITLWQPIEFYHTFGYQRCIDNLTSHNDLISCGSDLADNHGLNLLAGLGRTPVTPLPRMFHASPEPFLAPKVTDASTLFYIGINWERLGSAKGRFHDTLVALDRKELTDIYGPETVHGVAVWDGFRTYRGELPFDGESVKGAINRSGICLALSSVPHKNTGIMSNRLFEGLAGGAAIIATPNPLIDKYFSDVVYTVDDARGDAVLGQQITQAMLQIRADPAEAERRVLEGQRILREVCSLERSIQTLVESTPARILHHEAQALVDVELSVILTYTGEAAEPLLARIEEFARQKRATIDLYVICTARLADRHGSILSAAADRAVRRVVLHATGLDPTPTVFDGPRPAPGRTGPATLDVIRLIRTPFFAFATMEESVFSDHFATVAKAMADTPGAMAGCSGMIVRSTRADGVSRRSMEAARFVDQDSMVLVTGVNQVGRFVYSAALLTGPLDYLMPMLDGEEHSYFRLAAILAGPLAQTNYATFVQDETALGRARIPVEPIEHQRQYVRDLFARDPRWLDRLSRRVQVPEFICAYTPGVPLRWDRYVPPRTVTQRIVLNTMQPIRAGAPGLAFLVSGFSHPEPEHVWLEGERGIIEFSIPDNDDAQFEDLVVVLRAAGRPSIASGRPQHCTIAVNGMVIGYLKVPEEPTDLTIRLPQPMIATARTFRVELTPDHADPVYDPSCQVIDPRRLSLRLLAITLLRDLSDAPPLLVEGEIYKCYEGERGVEALRLNFHKPESNLTWIAGTSGTLRFRLKTVPRQPRLHLRLFSRRSLETGALQEATVIVNGTAFGPFQISEGSSDLVIDLLDADFSSRLINMTLRARNAEAVYDDRHEVIDGRLLGLALVRFGILDHAPQTAPPEEP